MPTLTAYATIKDGKLTLANRKRFEQDLTGFKDGAVEMVIKPKNRRSTQQNRYLWGVVYKEVEIRLKELGNDVNPEVVHEFLKGKFLKKALLGEGGELIDEVPGSTAELNKEDFSNYVEAIAKWAAEYLGLCIPAPNTELVGNCEYGLVLYRDKLPKFRNNGKMVFNCIDWPRDNDSEKIHPTQKPVELLKTLIEIFTDPGDVVIDPVAGSGSTLIAAERTGRKAYGFEIKKDFYTAANKWLEEEKLMKKEIKEFGFAKTKVQKIAPILF